MTPLFACFPVCLTFVGLAIVALIVVIFDVANRVPGDDDQPTATSRIADEETGPPPVWVMLLMIAAIVVTMLALAWYWPE